MRRSILAQSIHELWGCGATLGDLHADIRSRSHLWPAQATASFRFDMDCFRGTRTAARRLELIEELDYLPLRGAIRLADPEQLFTIFEHWRHQAVTLGVPDPERYYLGRLIARSAKDMVRKHDLKKRRYLSTTSMDAELALVTANIALADGGRLFYDPFAGTGSFPLAAAEWGAFCLGSDIDGRALRGDGAEKSLRGNFAQYGLLAALGGVFSADLTNSPVRRTPLRLPGEAGGPGEARRPRIFDGIVCDPPYGVREGLRVLGVRDPERTPWIVTNGLLMHKYVGTVPGERALHASADTREGPRIRSADQAVQLPHHAGRHPRLRGGDARRRRTPGLLDADGQRRGAGARGADAPVPGDGGDLHAGVQQVSVRPALVPDGHRG